MFEERICYALDIPTATDKVELLKEELKGSWLVEYGRVSDDYHIANHDIGILYKMIKEQSVFIDKLKEVVEYLTTKR